MGLFGLSFTSKTIIPQTNADGSFFYPIANGGIEWQAKQYLKDFMEVPEVNAIINMKARAFSNMKLSIVSKTTGKEVANNETLVRVLRNPNWYQSQKEFLMQTKLFFEIFGNEFIYLLKPIGMPNSTKAMYTISSELMDIEIKDTKTPYFKIDKQPDTVKYYANWNGTKIEIPSTDLIHLNKNKVDITPTDYLWGNSPLAALNVNVQNIRAAYEARNVIIANRGALGILSNGGTDSLGSTLPMDMNEKTKLQNEFKKYGLSKNQWQVIITNLNLKWQQMSIDADKLKLFEECREDTIKICDVYGVPFELLGNQQGVTFENKKTAERQFYQNTIIPEAQEWVSSLNDTFQTDSKSWEITATFGHLPVFADDMKERGISMQTTINALSKAYADGALTIEQYKNELLKYGI